MMNLKISLSAACFVVLLPFSVWSQTSGPDFQPAQETPSASSAAPQQSQPTHHLNATWQDGLALESDDGNYRIQFGTFMRFDGRFARAAAQTGIPDTFLLRTLRATFQGRIAKYFTFRLQPDFISKDAPVADAWADIEFSNAVHLRFGRDKVPLGMEVLLQDSNVLFIERGVTVNLMPLRDTGVQLHGSVLGDGFTYAVGVFNGQVDGASNNAYNVDTDSSKDVVVRLAARPFHRMHGRRFENLTLAMGGSRGRQENGPAPAFKTSVQQTYFAYNKDVIASGMRTRLAPQVSYYVGPVGTYAEYANSQQQLARGTTRADIRHTAWQAVGSMLLTGETAGERIHPKRAFDPERHQWGAVQLTARLGELSVDPEAIAQGLAEPDSSREARIATGGLNWFLTTNVKAVINLERSVFDHDANGPRRSERSALFRLQLNY